MKKVGKNQRFVAIADRDGEYIIMDGDTCGTIEECKKVADSYIEEESPDLDDIVFYVYELRSELVVKRSVVEQLLEISE